ncbi:hypothetical protein [Candidatus Reidiella endopervernicosa]|uniref:hypothetical protein n=1 Tax=Candidatus Reidiella endopervernicosa TaxID=2738883 RepID=UPI002A4E220B|nr:hypothetical protein [Candidatus Reidiella endopervernicosa]
MICSLPSSPFYRIAYGSYVFLFFAFLVMPLLAISVLAFNDSNFISLPWNGFTLDWFISSSDDRQGIFADEELITSIYTSLSTGFSSPSYPLLLGRLQRYSLKKRSSD